MDINDGLLSFGQSIGAGLQQGSAAYTARQKAQAFLAQLLGTQQPSPVTVTPQVTAANPANSPSRQAAFNAPAMSYQGGIIGNDAQSQKMATLIGALGKSDPETAQSLALPVLMSQFTEKPGFTLGQGENRYDASGNLTASGPAKTFAPVKAPEPPDIVRTAMYLFPNDPVKQGAYIRQNSAASVKGIGAPKAPSVSGAIVIPHPSGMY